MTYTIRDANPRPLAVTRRPRTQQVAQIQWHATRGNTTQARQVEATENWFANPANDLGGWGGSADFVVGPDWRIGGEIAIVRFGDWLTTFSSWSAGYGGSGTLPAAEYGVAIEVAQSASLEPFTPATIDACVWLVGQINHELRTAGMLEIPPLHLPYWDQLPGPVPRGHIGHDEMANGRRLGKSDPGPLFPYAELMARLQPVDAVDPFQAGRTEMYEAWVREEEAHLAYVRSLKDAWGVR